MSIPYMPFFVEKFEGHTAHLTMEQDGAYNRLIRLCWITPRCTLPNDHKWIKRRLRASDEQYEQSVMPVIEEFFKVKRGRLVNEKVLKEFKRATSLLEKRSEAGRKSAASRKTRKTKGFTPSSDKLLLQHIRQEQDTNKKYIKKFEEFWEIYPPCDYRKLDKSWEVWCTLDEDDQDLAIGGAQGYAAKLKDSKGDFVLPPQGFLLQGIYRDYKAAAPEKPVVIPDVGTAERAIYDAAVAMHSFDVWRAWFSDLSIVGMTAYASKFKRSRLLNDYPNVLNAAGFTLGQPKEESA